MKFGAIRKLSIPVIQKRVMNRRYAPDIFRGVPRSFAARWG